MFWLEDPCINSLQCILDDMYVFVVYAYVSNFRVLEQSSGPCGNKDQKVYSIQVDNTFPISPKSTQLQIPL